MIEVNTTFSFLVFLIGLCIGSFLNVVIYRLEKDEGFVKGRSYCPRCRHQLMWLDLIPVVSYLFLQGSCRYCHKKISWQYPLVEIITGLIFLLIFNFTPILNQFLIFNFINLLFLFYVTSSLIVIFVYDLKFYLIPDKVLFPAIGVTFLYRIFENLFIFDLISNATYGSPSGSSKFQILNFAYLGGYVIAVLIASGFFLSIYLISKGRWMGFGDVKLAILLGLVLGFPNILAGLFLSFFFGAIIGLGLMFFGKKGLKSELPFAPFLILGTFLAMFFGDQIIFWYTHFLVF